MVNAGMLTLGGNSTLDVERAVVRQLRERERSTPGNHDVLGGGRELASPTWMPGPTAWPVAPQWTSRGARARSGRQRFTGTGPVRVSASLDVADPVSIPNLQLDSGSLAGPATLTVTGTLGLNGTNSNALTGAHLINKGVATETGDYIGLGQLVGPRERRDPQPDRRL